jgi:hypothetical protein
MVARIYWEAEVTGTPLKARRGTKRKNADMPGKKLGGIGYAAIVPAWRTLIKGKT